MNNALRQQLYLIADEMRGMATLSRTFAANVYETERAHRMMELAAEVAALAEETPVAYAPSSRRNRGTAPPPRSVWTRWSSTVRGGC